MGMDDVPEIKALRRLSGIALFSKWKFIHCISVFAHQNCFIAKSGGNCASIFFYTLNIITDHTVFHKRPDTVMDQHDRVLRIFLLRFFQCMENRVLCSHPSRNNGSNLIDPVIYNQLLRISDVILAHCQIDLVNLFMFLKKLQRVDQDRFSIDLQKLLWHSCAHTHTAATGKNNCNIHASSIPAVSLPVSIPIRANILCVEKPSHAPVYRSFHSLSASFLSSDSRMLP